MTVEERQLVAFTVTVNPTNSDITLNCPDNISASINAPGETVVVTWNDPTGGTTCANGGFGFTQIVGPASGSNFGEGTATITYEASDNCGGMTICSFTVTVNLNNSNIDLNCPSNISIMVPQGSNGGVANWATPTATTTCTTGGGTSTCAAASISGFEYIGEYNDSEYYLSNAKATWPNAKTAAEAAGGTLAGIEDAAENAYIMSIIGSEIVHIGLNDIVQEGTLEWLNGEPTTYQNFSGINQNSEDKDYTVFYFWDGKWDYINDGVWKKYLMEIPCGGSSSPVNITQSAGPTSGSIFPIGTTVVAYQATDDCGNATTCSFTVTVTEQTSSCDPDTDGGQITGNESICDPYDPTVIGSSSLPIGGSGVIEYVWVKSESGCPDVNGQQIPNSNSPTYDPPLISTTTHFVRLSRRADCIDWVASNCVTKTVEDCNPPGGEYCGLTGEQPWQEYIINVSIGDLDHNSGKSSLGYEDNTHITGNLTAGQDYTLSVSIKYSWTHWDENIYVWIDFNQDNDFNDSGELVMSELSPAGVDGTSPPPITSSITIPASALNGTTRMRVAMKREASNNPCGSFVHGEVEDYSLNISSSALARAKAILVFEAYPIQGNAALEWVSNTSYKEAYFEVERSSDNEYFEVIEDVIVIANGKAENFYKIIDSSPELGVNYYRIKQVFQNGLENYTQTKKLTFGYKNAPINFYPNPAAESLYLQLKAYAGKKGTIQIVNILGQIMETVKMEKIPTETLRLPLDNYDNGMHTILFKIEGMPIVSKLFLIEKRQ